MSLSVGLVASGELLVHLCVFIISFLVLAMIVIGYNLNPNCGLLYFRISARRDISSDPFFHTPD